MTARCSVCRRNAPLRDLVEYGTDRICSSCKPGYFQSIQEGVAPDARSGAGARSTSPRVLPQPFPVLSTVMFILDIVFCSLGVLGMIVIFIFMSALLSKLTAGNGGAAAQVIFGVLVVLFSGYLIMAIVTNILLLKRKKTGVILGWIVMAIGALQILFVVGMAVLQPGAQAAIRIGIRLPFFLLWTWGLIKAHAWMNVPSNMQQVPLYQPTTRRRRPIARRKRPHSLKSRGRGINSR